MSEGTTVEAAIRAWERALATVNAARKAVTEAKAALASANRALDDVETLEDEARREAALLMPPGVGEGRTYEDAKGMILGDRFYLKFGDQEVRSMGVVNLTSWSPTPTGLAEGPDGHVWNPCYLKCPGCGWLGHVRYRPLQFDYRLRCDRCGHTWRSAIVDEGGGGA